MERISVSSHQHQGHCRADARLPLITISIVRTISFTIYTSTKRILNSSPESKPSNKESASAPWLDARLGLFNKDTAGDVAISSLIAGGASGAVVCVGSAPFELVKVGRNAHARLTAGAAAARVPDLPRLPPGPLRP